MPATLNFYPIIDQNQWRPSSPTPAALLAGSSLVGDMRNDATRHPHLYLLNGTASFYAYDPLQDDWLLLASPALSAFAAGAGAVFHPSQGPRGTLTSGNTATKVVLSTALPAAVGTNQLADRGDGVGFRIRIVGSSSGGSGLVQERTIVANSSGTTPTILLDSNLTGTTGQSGDTYEILSGRVFLLGSGAPGAGIWKYYDIATNSFSANLAFTNLPTVTTDSALVALSESHVPSTKSPGQGYYGNLVSTGTAAGTITGTAAGADAGVLINQFRNFQIRIVQDTTTPTAVGQRRRITSHTAGASPVYTLASNWTVTPTSGATFVIENDDDKIIVFSSVQANTYNYNITANTWDTTTWAAAAANGGGGWAFQTFGITPDLAYNVTNSQIVRIRGGNVSTIDVLDIAAGATGVWSNAIVYGGSGGQTFTTGTCGAYDPVTLGGKFVHFSINSSQRMLRFDMLNRVLSPGTYLRYPAGAAAVGARVACVPFVDASGSPKLNFLYQISPSNAAMFSMAVPR